MLRKRVVEKFFQLYNKEPIVIRAPGRINLIGEHTDYNDGYVFPAAIDRNITFAIAPNGTSNQCRLFAFDLDQNFDFDLSNFQPLNKGWPNYLMGVVFELQHNRGTQFDPQVVDAFLNIVNTNGNSILKNSAIETNGFIKASEIIKPIMKYVA